LQKQNDKAAEQRERQIEIAQAQLDHYVESGEIWNEVKNLVAQYTDPEAGPSGQLLDLLKQGEGYVSLSPDGQEDWMADLKTNIA
jgi:hypothetical protein